MHTYRVAAVLIVALTVGFGSEGAAFAETSSQSSSTSIRSSVAKNVCPPGLLGNLWRGSRGASVTALQEALASLGYFQTSASGYFGPITYGALVSFQRANGVPATGYFGPLSRAALLKRCSPQPGSVTITSISPAGGAVGTEVEITGSGFTDDNTVHFGVGVLLHVPIFSTTDIQCITVPCDPIQTLKFTVPESLNPACYYSNPRCLIATRQTTPGDYSVYVENVGGVSNSKTFTVRELVTSKPHIDSISPRSARTGEAVSIRGSGFTEGVVVHFYKNGEALGSTGGASVINRSRITFTLSDWIGAYCHPEMYCIALAKELPAGTYTIAVETKGGISNRVTFTKTDGGSEGTLSISGLDAPTTLAVGASGTWTVHTNQESSVYDATMQLHYSVVWGDEAAAGSSIMATPASVQSSATFTHTYQRAGTYTPVFTVSNNAGQSVSISATVVVTPRY